MQLIGVDFTLPEPRAIIATPHETRLIFVGDLEAIAKLAPPEHEDLVRAAYRTGFICGNANYRQPHG